MEFLLLCMLKFFTIIVAFSHFTFAQVDFNRDGVPHVTLNHGGILSGAVQTSRDGKAFSAFMGITYAVVPKRFEAPQPVENTPWKGVKEAVKPGHICPQPNRVGRKLDLTSGLSRDSNCLNLNVYVPRVNSTRLLPVMVWIHGGGFMFGNGAAYKPTFFMDTTKVILVTINYRLGVFGFFSTGDTIVPGNNGMKDQVMALKWIQQNIANFGGDKDKVTVFGESAGSVAVHYLTLSPSASGLFHRAISQSGSALAMWAYQPKPMDNAKLLAKHVGCPLDSSEEIVQCLRKLSAEELNEAQISYKPTWPPNLYTFFFVPTTEPEGPSAFLTTTPMEAMINEDAYVADVPWIVGATEDEGCVFYSGVILDKPNLIQDLDNNWSSLAPLAFDYRNYVETPAEEKLISEKIRSFYFGSKSISLGTSDNLTNLYSDSLILYSTYRAALMTVARINRKNPVYFYQYAYRGPLSYLGTAFQVTSQEAKKVGHGDELQHQFDLMSTTGNKNSSAADLKFSKRFNKLWSIFADTGYPGHPFNPFWGEPWAPLSTSDKILKWHRIDEDPSAVAISSSYQQRMQFWEDIWKDHIAPTMTRSKDTINASRLSEKTEL